MKIAVISASQPDTGMLTVELAAASLKLEFPEASFVFFTFPPQPGKQFNDFFFLTESDIEFRYLPESLDEVYTYDVIFFWGDFLNSHTWMNQSGPLQLQFSNYSKQEVREIILKCMLFKDAPIEVLQKTFLFGGTILPDKQKNLEDSEYYQCFIRLVSNCRKVWMREPISAARVSLLRKQKEDCLGVDAALILPENLYFPNIQRENEKNPSKIGLFVGSRTPMDSSLTSFLTALKTEFKSDINWLPWFKFKTQQPQSKLSLVKSRVKTLLGSPQVKANEIVRQKKIQSQHIVNSLRQEYLNATSRTLGDLLHQLCQYKFVVTDTYHVCINAWRMGVPAICISSQIPTPGSFTGTLKDEKKYILYLTYQATDFFVTLEQLNNLRNTNFLINTISSSQAQTISKRIQTHAKQVREELVENIKMFG